MATEKTYRRFIPVSQYDITGMEAWLSSMAEKGFFLTGLGNNFGSFKKAEPRPARYRLVPAGSSKASANSEFYAFYRENGWQYITMHHELFHIFMAKNTAAPEIHTDPAIQRETLKK